MSIQKYRERRCEKRERNWDRHLDSISFSSVNILCIPAAMLAWEVRGHDDKRMTQEPCEEASGIFQQGQRSVLPGKHCTPMHPAVHQHTQTHTHTPASVAITHNVSAFHTQQNNCIKECIELKWVYLILIYKWMHSCAAGQNTGIYHPPIAYEYHNS